MIELVGKWATSFLGWSHSYPYGRVDNETSEDYKKRIDRLPPMIGGIGLDTNDSKFHLREGYYVIAGVLCLELKADGTVMGFERFNRGGVAQKENQIIGTDWATRPHERFPSVQVGTIHTVHVPEKGAPKNVQNNYFFTVRSYNELDWVVYSSHFIGDSPEYSEFRYHARVAHGTFRRVADASRSPIRRAMLRLFSFGE